MKSYTLSHSKLLMLLDGKCPECRDTIQEMTMVIDTVMIISKQKVICLGCKREGHGHRFRDAYKDFAIKHFAEWSEE